MTTTNSNGVSSGLRAARQAVGLTRAQLAGLAGCSVSSLGFIEAGAVPRHSQVLERAYEVIAAHSEVGEALP
jgi:transcriptional regulator with XRE-family HTH domain